jgi:hypothetical protein
VHVDATTGPESSIGAYKLVICLGPADVPQGTPRRSPNGAQLLSATFTTQTGIFTTPSNATVWKTMTTPYAAGTPAPNAAGTVETRSLVGPGALTLRARITNKRKKLVALSGRVTQAGLPVASRVRILVNNKARFSVTSKANGSYSIRLKNTSRRVATTVFQARVAVAARDITATGCASPTQPPVACVNATAGGFTGLSAKVRVRL